jgi:hypothetical protein
MRAIAAVGALVALGPVSASVAATATTIGQIPPATPTAICSNPPADLFQATVGSGSSYTVPPGSTTLTSWSTYAAEGPGQTLKMKVFRKVGEPSTYEVVGVDGPRALVPATLNTFQVSIPVRPGDVIGLNDQNATTAHNGCIFSTLNPGDTLLGAPGDLAAGISQPFPSIGGEFRANVRATVTGQPPTIASIVPASGPIGGGTKVKITGQNFNEATAVDFGALPTTLFTVDSDTQITAIAPKVKKPAPVDITVVNATGTSTTAADKFTYEACVVPNLSNKKLKAAKKSLKRKACKLGKARGEKAGRVIKQNPKPGKVRAPGAKVSIKLG